MEYNASNKYQKVPIQRKTKHPLSQWFTERGHSHCLGQAHCLYQVGSPQRQQRLREHQPSRQLASLFHPQTDRQGTKGILGRTLCMQTAGADMARECQVCATHAGEQDTA